MKKRIAIDHLARVEGHGGITVELDGKTAKKIQFDIFEGARLIEGLLRGRRFEDVSQISSRICAICSVAHSVTSLKATEDAFGIEISEQTELLRDLMYRGENIESHTLHVFLLAAPDYLDLPSAAALAAVNRDAVQLGLRLKKLGNALQEIVGGRAIHPVNAVIGGFGKVPTVDQLIDLQNHLRQGLDDCRAMIDLIGYLPAADFCHSDTVYASLSFPGSYGYHLGNELIVLSNGKRETMPVADYRSMTMERAVPHSHAKHSMFKGEPLMVGALARLSINQDKLTGLAAEAVDRLKLPLPSDNPMDNNKAQAIEITFDVEHALQIVEHLLEQGFEEEVPPEVRPKAGTGTAATEAPRGLLFHSYTYDEEGRITAADIITPTAINAASAEKHLRSTVEESRESDEDVLKKQLEMIVRAYDPCISCSVH